MRMNEREQDNLTLLKAKYCPLVGAALCTRKSTKKTRDFDL